ncbi:MAG: penicillin-binding protein 2 [Clostridia bacterium]|nr:penicillin-binding protein 2 [Clostridia bacterium]
MLFLVCVARLSYIATDNTFKVADTQSSVRLDIATSRGTVYDCNMQPLTNDTVQYVAAVPPSSRALKEIEGYTLNEAQQSRLNSGYPIILKVDENFKSDYIKVFKIKKTSQEIAPHIIGYTDSENNGVTGIQQSYNDVLKGGRLSVRFKCDAKGNILAGEQPIIDNQDYLNAGSVVLTIDKTIQSITLTAAKKYLKKGAVVVLENSTAKIRGMVSVPDFNIANIDKAIKSTDAPMTNRATSQFNCGSVFKLCVAAAALEHSVSPEYSCKGNVKIGENVFNCLNLSGHGNMDMNLALGLSCNTYFINLGKTLGAKGVYDMAKAFGFGKSAQLCPNIVTASGNLPLLSTITVNPAALANFSFGQGELMVTPLQIASMIQTICNDGKLIKPTLIETESISPPTYVLNTTTAKTLKEYMINAVEKGTGSAAKPNTGGAGGKTATAQTGQFDKGREIVHAWFGGFFPADNPKYTVVVLAEDGITGSKSAAPVFKYIADNIK